MSGDCLAGRSRVCCCLLLKGEKKRDRKKSQEAGSEPTSLCLVNQSQMKGEQSLRGSSQGRLGGDNSKPLSGTMCEPRKSIFNLFPFISGPRNGKKTKKNKNTPKSLLTQISQRHVTREEKSKRTDLIFFFYLLLLF